MREIFYSFNNEVEPCAALTFAKWTAGAGASALERGQEFLYARCKAAISSFVIFIIAETARCDAALSAVFNSSSNARGTTCHETQYLSVNHPHCPFCPPSDSLRHRVSTSSCVSQYATSDMAGENLNCGPPFSATYSAPSSVNRTVM